MKNIFFIVVLALGICSCQTNEPEYLKRPDPNLSHWEYVEPTYEELCALWDADTTLANAKPDTIVIPNNGYYEPITDFGLFNSIYILLSRELHKDRYDPLYRIQLEAKPWHCKNEPHAGYYSSSCPQDSLVIRLKEIKESYPVDIVKYVYSTAAKCIIYDIKEKTIQKPNQAPQYVFSWRLLFTYKDTHGFEHCYYTEGHPEE